MRLEVSVGERSPSPLRDDVIVRLTSSAAMNSSHPACAERHCSLLRAAWGAAGGVDEHDRQMVAPESCGQLAGMPHHVVKGWTVG